MPWECKSCFARARELSINATSVTIMRLSRQVCTGYGKDLGNTRAATKGASEQVHSSLVTKERLRGCRHTLTDIQHRTNQTVGHEMLSWSFSTEWMVMAPPQMHLFPEIRQASPSLGQQNSGGGVVNYEFRARGVLYRLIDLVGVRVPCPRGLSQRLRCGAYSVKRFVIE